MFVFNRQRINFCGERSLVQVPVNPIVASKFAFAFMKYYCVICSQDSVKTLYFQQKIQLLLTHKVYTEDLLVGNIIKYILLVYKYSVYEYKSNTKLSYYMEIKSWAVSHGSLPRQPQGNEVNLDLFSKFSCLKVAHVIQNFERKLL